MKKKSEKKRTEAQGKRIGEQNFKSQNQPGQKKNHEAKNSICHFICDGPLEALCHMTYPSWGAHTDTSIHLFRHLTHLERDGGMDSKIEGKGDERMAGNKAFCAGSCLQHIVLTYMTMCQWARHIILHHFTLLWFPAHTCPCTQEQNGRA